MRFYKDPLVRRFVSGSVFAGLFVWVAVRYFDVDADVVYVLFVMSFVFVGVMMAVGIVGAVLIRLLRGKPEGMLGKLDSVDEAQSGAGDASAANQKTVDSERASRENG